MQELIDSYWGDATAQELIPQLLLDPTSNSDYQLDNGLLKFKGKLYVGLLRGSEATLSKHCMTLQLGAIPVKEGVYKGCKHCFTGPGSKRRSYSL